MEIILWASPNFFVIPISCASRLGAPVVVCLSLGASHRSSTLYGIMLRRGTSPAGIEHVHPKSIQPRTQFFYRLFSACLHQFSQQMHPMLRTPCCCVAFALGVSLRAGLSVTSPMLAEPALRAFHCDPSRKRPVMSIVSALAAFVRRGQGTPSTSPNRDGRRRQIETGRQQRSTISIRTAAPRIWFYEEALPLWPNPAVI